MSRGLLGPIASLCVLTQALAGRPDSAFVGWQGESFDPQAVFGDAAQNGSQGGRERWIETLSWSPRAFLYHGFLTEDEADQLVVESAPHLKRSTVVGGKNSNVVDNIRTSYGMFLNRLSSSTVETVEKKLANWTQLPIVHQEDIQILRYEKGQKYGAHYDALGRICTVLVYLTQPEEGGETAFPKTTPDDWADESQRKYEDTQNFSECARGHVAVKPNKGDALLFYSLKPDGQTTDDASMHTGCPLIAGKKWTATIWMHPTPFRPEGFQQTYEKLQRTGKHSGDAEGGEYDPGVCEDHNDKCKEWAAAGECEKNPSYLKGEGSDNIGHCRLACKVCEPCKPDDDACYAMNRVSAGYLNLAYEVNQLTGRSIPLRRDMSKHGH